MLQCRGVGTRGASASCLKSMGQSPLLLWPVAMAYYNSTSGGSRGVSEVSIKSSSLKPVTSTFFLAMLALKVEAFAPLINTHEIKLGGA